MLQVVLRDARHVFVLLDDWVGRRAGGPNRLTRGCAEAGQASGLTDSSTPQWWKQFPVRRSVFAMHFRSAVGIGLTWAMLACTSGAAPVRVGVDRGLEPLGLARFLIAAFEDSSKQRVDLRYGGVDELLEWANAGALDAVLMVSEDALAALEKEGLPIRAETYAHEELVLIGPFEDVLGRYSKASGAKLIQNVARSNFRYLMAKKGSVERARHDRLFRMTGDRVEPGSFFETNLDGLELVERALDDQALALVKRSSLLRAIRTGRKPHRIYKEADPALVLRLVLAEIHPGKTGRPRQRRFFDYVMGEEGQKAVAAFGQDRFGYPLFAPGAPPEGRGAGVPSASPEAAPKR